MFSLARGIITSSDNVVTNGAEIGSVKLSVLRTDLVRVRINPLFKLFLRSFFVNVAVEVLDVVVFIVMCKHVVRVCYVMDLTPVPVTA